MIQKSTFDISEQFTESWQKMLNLAADIFQVPAALVMRFQDPYIEVFLASDTEGNPYQPGSREHLWNSGLYCERVLKSRELLAVPNALEDEHWRDNPDIALNMVAYLGFPVMLPNNEPFGTICVLDTRTRQFQDSYIALLAKFRDVLQHDLELAYMNHELGDTNKQLIEYLGELKNLRGIVSICMYCKSIEDSSHAWHPVEKYLINHPLADFSHGICPVCRKRHLEE